MWKALKNLRCDFMSKFTYSLLIIVCVYNIIIIPETVTGATWTGATWSWTTGARATWTGAMGAGTCTGAKGASCLNRTGYGALGRYPGRWWMFWAGINWKLKRLDKGRKFKTTRYLKYWNLPTCMWIPDGHLPYLLQELIDENSKDIYYFIL